MVNFMGELSQDERAEVKRLAETGQAHPSPQVAQVVVDLVRRDATLLSWIHVTATGLAVGAFLAYFVAGYLFDDLRQAKSWWVGLASVAILLAILYSGTQMWRLAPNRDLLTAEVPSIRLLEVGQTVGTPVAMTVGSRWRRRVLPLMAGSFAVLLGAVFLLRDSANRTVSERGVHDLVTDTLVLLAVSTGLTVFYRFQAKRGKGPEAQLWRERLPIRMSASGIRFQGGGGTISWSDVDDVLIVLGKDIDDRTQLRWTLRSGRSIDVSTSEMDKLPEVVVRNSQAWMAQHLR